MRLQQVSSLVFDTPLLLEPGKARLIAEYLLGRAETMPDPEAACLVIGGKQHDDPVTIDGVRLLDISGTLVHRTRGLAALSGLLSYEQIALEFDAALTDPSVRGILLRVDSPGGAVNGAFDLADRIYEGRAAKPVWAVASDIAASAGYLLASAADRVLVTQSGVLGSIGVVTARIDQSGFDKERKVRVHLIYRGERKVDGSPHQEFKEGSDEHKALQRYVDSYFDLLASKIARHRGVSEEAIRATEGGVFVGAAGLEPALADDVASLDDALASLIEEAGHFEARGVVTAGSTHGSTIMPAIGPHKTATSDKSWDGPANEARLRTGESESYYRSAYAWQDPDGDATTKAAYKFINHEVAGDGKVGAANVNGCRAGIQVLNGGRIGDKQPSWWKDRSGIYNHLAKHMRDADVEPPDLKSESELTEGTMADKETTPTQATKVEEVSPEFVAQLRQDGAAAERQRLADIEALSQPGYEELVAKCKADPEMTADRAAQEILKEQKRRNAAQLQALKGDEEHLEKPEPIVDAGDADGEMQTAVRIVNAGRQPAATKKEE